MTRKKKRKISLIFFLSILGIFLICLLVWAIVWRNTAWTDDAYVHGNQVYLTPLHPGFVTAIHTDDTYRVQKGDILVELDQTDSLIALNKAKENLGQTVRGVCELYHKVFAFQAKIEAYKARFIRDAQDFEHRLQVVSTKAVSLENYEHSVASLKNSYYYLQNIKALYEKNLALIQGTTLSSHPLIKAAADRVRDAWVHLHRCNLYAPSDGIAAQRTIQVGMWVKAGTPLMSIIPTDQIWINANFKETQLKHMRIGQKAKVTVDLYGKGVVFHGKIVGLPAVAGNVTGLLPAQNLSGNWIKIVQRLPVRIELDPDEIKKHPLRLGLSSKVSIDLTEDTGPYYSTGKDSPIYQTQIYQTEEFGDQSYIDEIVWKNLDPGLSSYLTAPLEIPQVCMNIPTFIEKALFAESSNPLAPPYPNE